MKKKSTVKGVSSITIDDYFGKSYDSDNPKYKDPRTTASAQTDDVRDFGGGVLEPEIPNSTLIAIMKNNNIIGRSVDFFGKNFIAGGFDIVPSGTIDAADADADERAIIMQWFSDCVDEGTFLGVIKKAKIDQKICGNSAIEVARNKVTGKPERLFYMPIDTVRIAKGNSAKTYKAGQRFVQQEGYGTFSSTDDGVWYNKYQPVKARRNIKDSGFKKTLNEIIWNKEINPSDCYYGLSPIGRIVREHSLSIYSKDYNIGEFENGMLQKIAILVKNGNISPDSVEALKEFFRSHLRGTKGQSMIPVLNCVGQKAEIDIKEISKEMKDGSFLQLLEYVDQQSYVALGVPPMLLGIVKDANRSNAAEQKIKFIEDEIMPEQREDEAIWTKLVQKDLGYPNWKFVFKANKAKDTKDANEIATAGVIDGSFSINDKLRHLGREPIRNEKNELDEGAEMHVVTTAQGVMIPVSELKNLAGNWQEQITNNSVNSAKENVKKLHNFLKDKRQAKDIIDGKEDGEYSRNDEYKEKLSKNGFTIKNIQFND